MECKSYHEFARNGHNFHISSAWIVKNKSKKKSEFGISVVGESWLMTEMTLFLNSITNFYAIFALRNYLCQFNVNM